MDKITKQRLIIKSQNIIDCLKFFMRYKFFWKTKNINHLIYKIKKRIGYIIRYIQVIDNKKNKKNFLLKLQ